MDAMIAALADDHGLARRDAREALIKIGQPAVAPLIRALEDPKWQIRWGAAKALGQIGDPTAASALVKTLKDERPGVRWLAAEALITLGRSGLKATLEALVHHSDSLWLRESAHHIVHDIAEQDPNLSRMLAPMSRVLDDIVPTIQVPPAAQLTLEALNEPANKTLPS
jgi:HEAT repeat protein